jgi:hypothetical protein
MKTTKAAELIERVRTTGKDYLDNQADFPRVVLAYGRALLKARHACGDDNSAFGSWLRAHHLDKVGRNDRAALINLARHAKVAVKVLRATTSRSVRLVWEDEVKPVVYPRAFPSIGIGEQPRTIALAVENTVRTVPLAFITAETRTINLKLPTDPGEPPPCLTSEDTTTEPTALPDDVIEPPTPPQEMAPDKRIERTDASMFRTACDLASFVTAINADTFVAAVQRGANVPPQLLDALDTLADLRTRLLAALEERDAKTRLH